jgi:DNA-binding transcriptional LysR family regulator
MKGLQHGQVRLAISEGFVDVLIQQVLAEFCTRYPKLEVVIDMLSIEELVASIAEARAHVGLAYNPPAHDHVEWRASSAQPVVLLVHPQHRLALRGGPACVQDLLECPLALMPSAFGVAKAVEMLAFAENIEIRPTLVTNSLTALKRMVAAGRFATLIGAFAAQRELEAGELAVVPIAHPLFQGAQARLLVRAGRPLGAAGDELLAWIGARMAMFASTGDAGR